MVGLGWDGSNPDVDLLYDVNGVARDAPHWVDRSFVLVGQYGCLAALLALAIAGWLVARRRPDAPAAVAGVLWAGLAAGIGVLLGIPIRGFVDRPRPSVAHSGIDVLTGNGSGTSFVSDHATVAMTVAVALFLVSHRLGLLAAVVALVQGFTAVYTGVHYPSDVIGGFALGTATALLLAPLAMALLTPLSAAAARSRLRGLVTALPRTAQRRSEPHPEPMGKDTDLAA